MGDTWHVIHECHNLLLLLMAEDQRWKEMLKVRVASSIKEKRKNVGYKYKIKENTKWKSVSQSWMKLTEVRSSFLQY